MEVFIANTSHQATDDGFRAYITNLLAIDQILTFDLRKTKKRGCAILTLPDVGRGQQFLAKCQMGYGTRPYLLFGTPVVFRLSNKPPTHFLLEVLRKEEKDRLLRLRKVSKRRNRGESQDQTAAISNKLPFSSLSFGRWEARQGRLVFVPFASYHAPGSITVNTKSLTLTVSPYAQPQTTTDIVIDFYSLHSVAIEPAGKSTIISITSEIPPKIYVDNDTIPDDFPDASYLSTLLASLNLNTAFGKPSKLRETTFASLAPETVSCCLVYRVALETTPNIVERLLGKSFGAINILNVKPMMEKSPDLPFSQQVRQLTRELSAYGFSYHLEYQISALWIDTFLSPNEVRSLLPQINNVVIQSGESIAVHAAQTLRSQLPFSGPENDAEDVGLGKSNALMILNDQSLRREHHSDLEESDLYSITVSIHKAMVTPTGVYLDGPDDEPLNRVLRQHRAQVENFLRVSFLDEDGERVQFDRDSSNEKIFHGRFKNVLRRGLDIGNKHFDFLGFSHSSLRSQACWFMAPFQVNDELLQARTVINRLGDFTHIRCPAKCAARIGQAFSDSQSAIPIKPEYMQRVSDITVGDYTFSDGVGTFSRAIWTAIQAGTKSSTSRRPPTLYQIRYRGAKGMISLDTRLQGHQLRLRDSMIKFEGSPSSDIEICGSATRPLPMKLNRPHIKILEDLGVDGHVFESLQVRAIQKLRSGTASSQNARAFLKDNLADGSTRLPGLLTRLSGYGLDATADPFIRDLIGALIQVQLRELKYRSRIPVEGAVTLYGIMDETGFLREDEVYCCFFRNEDKRTVLEGTVAVTRSPALHPGDVQLARAVSVPNNSPLADLHNCIIFSQKGARDLPSQLGGGDLDGDLYNVIYDPGLLPKRIYPAAAYSRPKPQDIGRPVTAEDMTDFFIDFMENDQLGRISTLHQVFADQEDCGTMSPQCLALAALHSTAVDFSKTGIPVNLKLIPRAQKFRPDFMAPSASVKVEKGIVVRNGTDETSDTGDTHGYRYYESHKILGKLYRSIDEEAFFETLQEDGEGSIFSRDSNENVLQDLWAELLYSEVTQLDWRSFIDEAEEIKESYESDLVDSMFQYSTHRAHHLTGKEVFLGKIINSKSGAATKRQRELSLVMKERFNREVRETIAWIREGGEALERSLACLYVAQQGEKRPRQGRLNMELHSFGWVAAAVCLEEVEKHERAGEQY